MVDDDVVVDVVDVDVVGGSVVVVVVVVVVVASTMVEPNCSICRNVKVARVRYPATVRCTPSAMNRLTLLGTK